MNVNDLLLNDSDLDGDSLSVNTTPVSGPASGTLVLNANGTFTYTPNANFNGTDSFVYQVTDGNGGSTQAVVAITVNAVNDAPTSIPVTLNSIAEDSGVTTITQADLLAGASDVDGDPLSAVGLTITSGNGTLVDNGDGTWSYTPAANDDSAVTFGFAVSDGTVSTNGVATLDITPVNDAPSAPQVTINPIAEDSGPTTITQADLLAGASDIDGDPLSAVGLSIVSGNGTLVDNGDGTWTYTPAANDDSEVTFGFSVSDGTVNNTGGVATLDITPVNDAPVIDLDSDNSSGAASGFFQTSYTAGSGFVSIVDPSDAILSDIDSTTLQSLTIQITNLQDGSDEGLAATVGAGISQSYDSSTGTLVLTGPASAADFEQALQSLAYNNASTTPDLTNRLITIVANDGANTSNIVSTTIIVEPDSTAPTTLVNTGSTVSEGGTDAIEASELQSSDLQPTDSLGYTVTSAPANGFLALAGNPTVPVTNFTQEQIDSGELIYVHDGSETLSDQFTFSVDDGQGNQLTGQTFDISVDPVAEAPTDITPDSVTIAENTDTNGGIVALNLATTDVDAGDTFTYSILPGADAANFSIAGNQLVFDGGNLDFETQSSYDVRVQTTDSHGLSYVETLTVLVSDVNEAPIVVLNQGTVIDEGSSIVIDNSLLQATDQDLGSDSPIYSITQVPSNGVLTIGGVVAAPGSTFTQTDIDAGLVSYTHSGNETHSMISDLTSSMVLACP